MAAGITLLGGFKLTINTQPVKLKPAAARLVAAIALHGPRSLERRSLGALLWSDKEQRRRLANVRGVLSRLPPEAHQVLVITPAEVGLADCTKIDTQLLCTPGASGLGLDQLSLPLLPGWYDDWVLLERDRIALVQIAALECRAEQLLDLDRPGEAIEAAFASILIEPLREHAHRIVIRCHLAEGNIAEACAHFSFVQDLFDHELGVALSAETIDLLHRRSPSVRSRRMDRRWAPGAGCSLADRAAVVVQPAVLRTAGRREW